MKIKLLVLVGISLAVGLLTALHAADEPKKDNQRKYDALAQNIVTRSARIKEGDLVQITGQFKDQALLEALAVQVRKQGGRHLLDISSDRLNRRLLDEVPAKFDSQEPKWDMKFAELIDVQIAVDSADEDALAGVPAERLTKIRKAAEPVFPLLLKRNVRRVGLGNGLYPTASFAKKYGLTEEAAWPRYSGRE